MEKVLEFLGLERVCSFSIVLPDGSSHSAALHYSHNSDPLEIYFSTERSSRKCSGIKDGGSASASVVVGFSEEGMVTLQLSGTASIVGKDQLESIHQVHYQKHPGSEQYKDDPETVFIKFVPSWWRYTDYKTVPMTTITN